MLAFIEQDAALCLDREEKKQNKKLYIVHRGEERPLVWMQRTAINPRPSQDAGIIAIDH